MSQHRFDFDLAVVGGGFAGSLTALLLRQLGQRVLLIDRGHHPRFAIGESSTPSSNLLLRALGARYNVSELIDLSRYGTWKRKFPELGVGLKRGFSYFGHTPGEPFRTTADHDHELLVAASTCDEVSDTQWLRSDFDAWMIRRAIHAGAEYLPDRCVTNVERRDGGWHLTLGSAESRPPVEERVAVPFVIEASGLALDFARHLGVETTTAGFRTNSRAVFAHFEGLPRWEESLTALGVAQTDYPFRADDAALHHLFDAGWMWQLRFDHGVTSAGFAINQHVASEAAATAKEEFSYWLNRLPSVRDQFASARIVAPAKGLVLMDRLQRRASQLHGPGWVGLPNSAGFIDPLFSAGNAHVLAGIERVLRVFEMPFDRADGTLFKDHVDQTFLELMWIDELVSGCYAMLPDFAATRAMAAWYFAAAVGYERHRLALDKDEVPGAFLLADHLDLRTRASVCREAVFKPSDAVPSNINRLDTIRQALGTWDAAGVLAPAARSMIRRSAVE